MPAQGQGQHASTTIRSRCPFSISSSRSTRREVSVLTRQTIGERVLARRHSLDLSQEALAEVAGVSRETIRRVEQGSITPNLITFGKIADGLRVSPAALLAEKVSDELTELVLGLPDAEQENMVVMIRALADHLAAAGR